MKKQSLHAGNRCTSGTGNVACGHVPPEPLLRFAVGDQLASAKRQGRNEPCSCGSGKKRKRCCK